MPKPNMVMSDTILFVVLVARAAKAPPMMGPVQEKETNTVVRAMKKGANKPPLSACSSDLLIHFSGILISNSPKKEGMGMQASIVKYARAESADGFRCPVSAERHVVKQRKPN